MNKLFLSFLILLYANVIFGQTIYPTGAKKRTPELLKFYNEQVKDLPIVTDNKPRLVSHIDNSKLKFFPPVFCQNGGSCAQAAGVGYIYTYEVNCMLDRNAGHIENRFSYMYTWNLLNYGKGYGSNEYEGWNLIKDNGAICCNDFDTYSSTEWVSGYEKYYNGMKYSIEDYYKINARRDYKSAVNEMKRYLIDHGDGSEYGGLICFSALAHSLRGNNNYDGPSYTGYNCVVGKFSDDGAHCMTIVGFDDIVEWDVNGDGSISDDEVGAFVCVNSWGKSWGDNGHFYMPYKLLDISSSEGGCYSEFLTVRPKIVSPNIVYKIKMEHSSRNDICFELGVSQDVNASVPTFADTKMVMYMQGGDHSIRGLKPEILYKDIEIGLDASFLAEKIEGCDNPKFFLKISGKDRGEEYGEGRIISFSVLDYRTDPDHPEEYRCKQEDMIIENNTDRYFSVKPFSYEYDDTEKVSFNIAVNEDNSLSVKLGVKERVDILADLLDSVGNKVVNLLDESVDKGNFYRLCKNDKLISGEYYVRIIADNQIAYKKIIIK